MNSEPKAPDAERNQDAWWAAARQDVQSMEPPAWLEHQLRERLAEASALAAVRRAGAPLEAVQATQPLSRRSLAWRLRPPSRPVIAALATFAAACVALAVGVAVVLLPPEQRTPQPAAAVEAPFIALTSLDAISAELEATVVTAQVPRSTLGAFGLPMDPARADVPLNTELLMSPRGVVLAVRFLD